MYRGWIARSSQFIIFAMIGGMNTLIHGSLLVLGMEVLACGLIGSHMFAFYIANLFSYFMNSFLTFRAPLSLFRYMRFLLASLGSLGFTLVIARLADFYHFHYLLGFVLIVVLVPALSFLVMKFWAFSLPGSGG